MRDDFHEREPGKILHELRFGELTARGERPYSPYFGTADATPLFLVLLDEYHRWSGDDELVRDARAQRPRGALAWIEDSGDADGDGYVEYACRNPATGLVNQCWKDSWNAIQFADGTLAQRADRDLRDPGLRLRRPAPLQPAWPARCGATTRSPSGWSAGRASCATRFQPRLLDARARLPRRSRWTATSARSTA